MFGYKELIQFQIIYNNYQFLLNLALYKEWLLAFAEANKMPVIDFDTNMKNQLRAGYSRYFMDGAHPNPAGHKIMAGIAKKAFQDMGILPEDQPQEDNRFEL